MRKLASRSRLIAVCPMIDTHCHLDTEAFNQDRLQVLASARRAGVNEIIIPAIRAVGWQFLLDLCATDKQLYPALGLHPLYLEQHRAEHIESLEHLIRLHRPVAVGEIGLDYWDKTLDQGRQQYFFEAQLVVAATANLPVLLHVRKTHDQVLNILKQIQTCGGIVHAFNGSLQQAYKYIDMGFKLGFGGMLTFERSRKLRALVQLLPTHALVLETDAPDLTVASHKAERNSPEYLPECLAALAQARGEKLEITAEYTTRNAREIMAISSAK